MRRSGRKNKISVVILWCGIAFLLPMQARAQESSLPPHLIQTVSSRDIYEGMVELDLLCCPVLEEEDRTAARGNVENSVVRLIMGTAYGSGVIYELQADAVIIATNRHVLQYWDNEKGIVCFPQGYFVNAVWLGSSEVSDVGFLRVEESEFDVEALLALRSVSGKDTDAYLRQETEVFCLGADREVGEMMYQEAVIEEPSVYIEAFDADMLYGKGFAKEGMSGGGIFDGYGHWLGLLAGGTDQNEIAGVPAGDVAAAYREILAK